MNNRSLASRCWSMAFLATLGLSVLTLSACDKNSGDTTNQALLDGASDASSANPAKKSSGPTSAQPDQPRATSATTQPAPAPQPPPVAPTPTFNPTLPDIVSAFDAALAKTYHATPPGAAREAWLAQERPKLNTLRAQSCTASTPGTASVCQIQFNGVNAQIKIMLTQQGWVLVN